MIETVISFNHLMGLDLKPRLVHTGLRPETLRRWTPATGIEEVKRGKMGFKQLETSTLPVVRMTASEPRITIRENGQAVISTTAAVGLGADSKYAIVMRDEEKGLLAFRGVVEKPKEGLKLNRPTKSKSVSVSLGGVLNKYFPNYKFREAGSQPYDAQIVKKGQVTLVVVKIPDETPEYRAPAVRKKKVKKEAPVPAPEAVASSGGEEIMVD